jgi:hypothetical protein
MLYTINLLIWALPNPVFVHFGMTKECLWDQQQRSAPEEPHEWLLAEALQELPVLWPWQDLPERPSENETHPACESHKTIGQASTI